MTRTPLPRALPRAAALALALLLTAGCSSDDGGGSGSRAAATGPTPDSPDTRSASPEVGRTPADRGGRDRPIATQKPPRPRGNALTIRTAGPDGHLIAGDDLGDGWRVRTTGNESGRVLSPCHRASMSDIGASTTRLRDFSGPGDAVQAVSRFVDRKSAWRIERVVAAWAEDCVDDLRDRDAALGAVRHGSWLSVVEVSGVAAPRHRLHRALAAVDATF